MVATGAYESTGKNFSERSSFTHDDLVACGFGKLFAPENARLPVDEMLMFDTIEHIDTTGGAYGKGQVEASLALSPDAWFFGCHFRDDPVMPGCLGLDALWQLMGFFLAWTGGAGKGRALGCGEVKFSGQILPSNQQVQYRLDIKRLVRRGLTMGVADGTVLVDGATVYRAQDLKVGLFVDPGAAL